MVARLYVHFCRCKNNSRHKFSRACDCRVVNRCSANLLTQCRYSGVHRSSKFLSSLWPVFAQDTRERTIRQELAAGLAVGTVVRLVRRVANALNLCATTDTWLTEAAVHGHSFAKRSNPFRKCVAGFIAESFNPLK